MDIRINMRGSHGRPYAKEIDFLTFIRLARSPCLSFVELLNMLLKGSGNLDPVSGNEHYGSECESTPVEIERPEGLSVTEGS